MITSSYGSSLPKSAGTPRHLVSSNAGKPIVTSKGSNMNVLRFAALIVASSVFALAGAQTGPSDPQIAGIVVAANQIDIDAGKIAKSRSKNKEVQEFAQRMITDHGAVNKQASALVKKLNVKPEESDTSRGLKSAAKSAEGKLKALKGAEFDKAYVDNEVAYHQQVLDAIDKVLIPSAKNAELKSLIEKVRPAIAAHLDHAKMLQSSVGKK
jgi:putative membrane protein